jgi:hypothetical protein
MKKGIICCPNCDYRIGHKDEDWEVRKCPVCKILIFKT